MTLKVISFIFLAIMEIAFFISLYFATRKGFSFKSQISASDMTLRMLQKEHFAWAQHNFPNRKPYQPLLGVSEEVGELCHAHLKMEQGIRGTPAEHQAAKEDAVGDILIYLTDYCSLNGIDMEKALETSWAEVSKRDWIKFPKNGVSE